MVRCTKHAQYCMYNGFNEKKIRLKKGRRKKDLKEGWNVREDCKKKKGNVFKDYAVGLFNFSLVSPSFYITLRL